MYQKRLKTPLAILLRLALMPMLAATFAEPAARGADFADAYETVSASLYRVDPKTEVPCPAVEQASDPPKTPRVAWFATPVSVQNVGRPTESSNRLGLAIADHLLVIPTSALASVALSCNRCHRGPNHHLQWLARSGEIRLRSLANDNSDGDDTSDGRGESIAATAVAYDEVLDLLFLKTDAKLDGIEPADKVRVGQSTFAATLLSGNTLAIRPTTITSPIVLMPKVPGAARQIIATDRSEASGWNFDQTGCWTGWTVGDDDEPTTMMMMPFRAIAELADRIDDSSGEAMTVFAAARLGVALEPGSTAAVQTVQPDSPAERAGIEQDDRIQRIGRHTIRTSDDVVAAIGGYRAGQTVEIVWTRDGEERRASVELDRRIEPTSSQNPYRVYFDTATSPEGTTDPKVTPPAAWLNLRDWSNLKQHPVFEYRHGKMVPVQPPSTEPANPRRVIPPSGMPLKLERDSNPATIPKPKLGLPEPRSTARVQGFRVERSGVEESLRKLDREQGELRNQLNRIESMLKAMKPK